MNGNPMLWLDSRQSANGNRVDGIFSKFRYPISFLHPNTFQELPRFLEIISAENNRHDIPTIFFICFPDYISNLKYSITNPNTTVVQLLLGASKSVVQFLQLNSHIYGLFTSNKGTSYASVPLVELFYVYEESKFAEVKIRVDNKTEVITDLLAISTRRYDLQSTTIRILAQQDEIYKDATNVEMIDGKFILKDGHCADAFFDIVHSLRFKYETVLGKGWIRTVSSTSGERLTGMGEQILAGEAELGVSCSTIMPDRVEKLRFLQPITFSQSMSFYREPPVASRNIQMLPFQGFVWMNLFTFLAVILFFTVLASKLIPYKNTMSESLDVTFTVLGCILQQGWHSGIKTSHCIQIISVTTMFFSFVMSSFYTGAYVATVYSPSSLIKSFQDLRKYNFEIFTDPTLPYYGDFFANDELSKQGLADDSKRLYMGDKDAIEKIMDTNSRYAFILNDDNFFALAFDETYPGKFCKIQALKHQTRIKDGMFLRKDSPFIEMLSHRTIMLLERGLNARYKQKYFTGVYIKCSPRSAPGFAELELGHCILAFKIYSAGSAFAVAIAFMEYTYNHFQRRKCRTPATIVF